MSDDEDGAEDDPFDRLDESVDDREGNPFEQLDDLDEGDDGSETDRDDQREPSVDETGIAEPGYEGHDVTPAGHKDEVGESETVTETDSDAPGHRANSDAPAHAETDSDALAESDTADEPAAIEQEEPSIDTGSDDGISFGDASSRGDPFEEELFEQMDVGDVDPDEVWQSMADAEEEGSISQQTGRLYAEVSKHRYCEQCEFFSDPPDVHCSHDGTDILEFLDHETVRVVDCPIVAERKELQKHE